MNFAVSLSGVTRPEVNQSNIICYNCAVLRKDMNMTSQQETLTVSLLLGSRRS